jgi:extradiol dioxygenase family protein
MTAYRPFHLAFPVHDLEAARVFYGHVLACPQGREDAHWIDYDLYGHQIVAHLDKSREAGAAIRNAVDGDAVPVPHFGVVLTVEQFEELRVRLEADETTRWVIRPKVRFAGEVGEQHTMFLLDPSGNALEFKAFADDAQLFAT